MLLSLLMYSASEEINLLWEKALMGWGGGTSHITVVKMANSQVMNWLMKSTNSFYKDSDVLQGHVKIPVYEYFVVGKISLHRQSNFIIAIILFYRYKHCPLQLYSSGRAITWKMYGCLCARKIYIHMYMNHLKKIMKTITKKTLKSRVWFHG